MLLLFVFGVCLSPCYYIPASIFSAEFGRSRAGILVSLLDAAGFAATGTFYWTCTRLAESHGWSTLLWLLAGIGLIAALLLAVFLHRESDRRIRSGS
jgi:MFS family permease